MVDEFFHWLLKVREAHFPKDMRPKTNVEKMCYRMVPANIIIEGRPIISIFRIPSGFSILWICIAKHVPATTGIAVHRIGFALGRATTSRACRIYPVAYAR
ncbi:hypothetical protein D3C85_1152630 [compost metagenome]